MIRSKCSPMEDRDMNTNKHHEGWELRESGPAGADHAVLLLAGALVTAAYYDDVLAEPKLTEASVRFVAATLPGFAGTQPPDDLSMDNYARLAGNLAAGFSDQTALVKRGSWVRIPPSAGCSAR